MSTGTATAGSTSLGAGADNIADLCIKLAPSPIPAASTGTVNIDNVVFGVAPLCTTCTPSNSKTSTPSTTITPPPSATPAATHVNVYVTLTATVSPTPLSVGIAYVLDPSIASCASNLVTVLIAGGAGAGSATNGLRGGNGAAFTVTFPMTAGFQSFGVVYQGSTFGEQSGYIGAAPGPAAGGAGGSAASVFWLPVAPFPASLIAVAGGGGGAGQPSSPGGNASAPMGVATAAGGPAAVAGQGGSQTAVGASGSSTGCQGIAVVPASGGGSYSSPGIGGSGCGNLTQLLQSPSNAHKSGSAPVVPPLATGGIGYSNPGSGGGGGGGYYGGGGGGNAAVGSTIAGGGGGGSSWVLPDVTGYSYANVDINPGGYGTGAVGYATLLSVVSPCIPSPASTIAVTVTQTPTRTPQVPNAPQLMPGASGVRIWLQNFASNTSTCLNFMELIVLSSTGQNLATLATAGTPLISSLYGTNVATYSNDLFISPFTGGTDQKFVNTACNSPNQWFELFWGTPQPIVRRKGVAKR